MNKRLLKNLDLGIIICVILLLLIGLISLYSASESTDFEEFKKQCIWIVISIPVLILTIFIDYNTFAKLYKILYALLIILLIAVFFTSAVNRSKKLV